MKVIFLDIDGVLTHISYTNTENYDLDEEKIKLLKKIINKTEAKIVLISSWRNTNLINNEEVHLKCYWKLIEVLKKYNIEIYSETPKIKTKTYEDINNKELSLEEIRNIKIIPETTRAGEIKVWLENNPNIETFIILDDEFFSYYEYFGYDKNLIKTSYYDEGLKEEHFQKAIKILNKSKQRKR